MFFHQLALSLGCSSFCSNDNSLIPRDSNQRTLQIVIPHIIITSPVSAPMPNAQLPHDDPLNEKSVKAIANLNKLLVQLRESTGIHSEVKELYALKAIRLCRANNGFSEGLRHYTTQFIDANSQQFAREKRKTWKKYIKRTRHLAKKIESLLPSGTN